MNPNITPIIETANALQYLIEALDKLAPAVEPMKRAEYEKCVAPQTGQVTCTRQ